MKAAKAVVLRHERRAGEPVAKRGAVGRSDLRIEVRPVARGIQIHQRFGVGADDVGKHRPLGANVEQRRRESIGAVRGMTQPGVAHVAGVPPRPQQLIGAVEMFDQAPGNVRHLAGRTGLEERHDFAVFERPRPSTPTIP